MPDITIGNYIIGYPLLLYFGYRLAKTIIKKAVLPPLLSLLLKLHAWENSPPRTRKDAPVQAYPASAPRT